MIDEAPQVGGEDLSPGRGPIADTATRARMILSGIRDQEYGANVDERTATRNSAVADAARSGLAQYHLLRIQTS